MCMNTGGSPSSPDVEPENITALAGQGLTTQDPRFVANKVRKKRMNLRVRRPSPSSTA